MGPGGLSDAPQRYERWVLPKLLEILFMRLEFRRLLTAQHHGIRTQRTQTPQTMGFAMWVIFPEDLPLAAAATGRQLLGNFTRGPGGNKLYHPAPPASPASSAYIKKYLGHPAK